MMPAGESGRFIPPRTASEDSGLLRVVHIA